MLVLSKYYIITIKEAALGGLRANSTRNTLRVTNSNYKIMNIPDCYLVVIKKIHNRSATCIY